MNRAEKYALDTAKEITIAKASNSTVMANKEGGENVAAFFEAVYTKVLEIAKNVDD